MRHLHKRTIPHQINSRRIPDKMRTILNVIQLSERHKMKDAATQTSPEIPDLSGIPGGVDQKPIVVYFYRVPGMISTVKQISLIVIWPFGISTHHCSCDAGMPAKRGKQLTVPTANGFSSPKNFSNGRCFLSDRITVKSFDIVFYVVRNPPVNRHHFFTVCFAMSCEPVGQTLCTQCLQPDRIGIFGIPA